MRTFGMVGSFLFVAAAMYAQSDRGQITGTVADPAGAVVPNAPVEGRNVDTGALYQAATSATGNYTMSQLPAGQYKVSVSAAGFKKAIRSSLEVGAGQTLRLDFTLEVGQASETVTVSSEAPLLQTESGEMSTNVKSETLDNLPVISIGAGAGNLGVRNPYSVVQLLPGSDWRPDASVRINGMPGNTQALRVEGQDSTNQVWQQTTQINQVSVDAIQEFNVQTSNYAAEYGQAGGSVLNVTMKSGTNVFHGSGYEYFVNEALNAGDTFSHIVTRQRRNDYGGTIGGAIFVPHVYNGKDRFFFFFNFEQYRETIVNPNTVVTVPTDAMRTGDLSSVLTGRNLCPAANPNCDPLGRPIFENQVYDPRTDQLVSCRS